MRHVVRCALALTAVTPEVAAEFFGKAKHSAQKQPNPPTWPQSVFVFGPKDSKRHIESVVRQAFATNGGHIPKDYGQFSTYRFAFLFRPGTYYVDVPVGYYT